MDRCVWDGSRDESSEPETETETNRTNEELTRNSPPTTRYTTNCWKKQKVIIFCVMYFILLIEFYFQNTSCPYPSPYHGPVLFLSLSLIFSLLILYIYRCIIHCKDNYKTVLSSTVHCNNTSGNTEKIFSVLFFEVLVKILSRHLPTTIHSILKEKHDRK